MVRVNLTPEGKSSFKKLPPNVKEAYDRLLIQWESSSRLRLPGGFPTHQLEGVPSMWTLKIGTYRGIFHRNGQEAGFVRFGHRQSVYQRLPK